jgi:small subunit ribosomal protein S18
MPKPHRPTREKRSKGKYIPRRKVCLFCADKTQVIDYKEVSVLGRFISDRGRIEPRRKTGVCPKHQRTLGVAIKRARYVALLPYTADHIRQTGGPGPREQFRGGADRRPRAHLDRQPKEETEKQPE